MILGMFRNRWILLLFLTITLLVLIGSSLVLFEVVTHNKIHSSTQKLEAIINSTSLCKVPCWQGLTPGKSTENDFLTFANSEYANSRFQDLRKNENPVIYYLWDDFIMELPMEIRINNDNIISFISFVPDNFIFGTIVKRLGYPDAYEAAGFSDMSYYVTMKFFYESEGLVVWVNTRELESFSDPCKIPASLDLYIRAIYLTQPGTANEIVATVDQFFDPSVQEVRIWPETNLLELKPCP